MFGLSPAQSEIMASSKNLFVLLLCTLFSLPVSAQFRSLMDKADKQYELKAFNLAVKSYREALQQRPENADALFKIADCYRHLNEMESSAEWFGRAILQRRVNDKAHLYFGHVLKALGRYDEAFYQYQEYIKTDPVAGRHYQASCNYAKSLQNNEPDYEIFNEGINTASAEFGPAFYKARLVYASARKDIQMTSTDWTGMAYNQLFSANMAPGTGALSTPVFLHTTLGESINQGPLSFSADGKQVIFTRNNFVDGTRLLETSGMELNLFTADISNEGVWTGVKPFQHNISGYSTGFPSLSPDGQKLFFASNRPDGYGGYDIYVSYKVGEIWTLPENLGPVVNSPGNEISPFYEGNNLYFSSDWHHGLGGYDVFKARMNNNRWAEITNEGPGINSSYDDYGFIIDAAGNKGYLCSNRPGSRGGDDVFRFQGNRSDVVISVKNAADGNPLSEAEIDFGACGNGTVKTDVYGMYRFKPVLGETCDLLIRKEGFLDVRLSLNTAMKEDNRMVFVNMSREGEAFSGRVIDYQTRLPIPGVSVFATHTGTGSYLVDITDENGAYALSLSADAVYMIRYSVPGYREINRTVRTNGRDRSVLGVVSIMMVNAPLTRDELVAKSGTGGDENIVSGFSVQVSAMKNVKLDMFDRLRSIGVVYTVKENQLTKVRVGVFVSKSQAQLALVKIREQGYKTAFIVEEKGTRTDKGIAVDQPSGGGLSEKTVGAYSIQLGAYRNTAWFDDSKVRNLGIVTERQKGTLTIKLLSGFATERAAKGVLGRVQSSGFPGAFIMKNP